MIAFYVGQSFLREFLNLTELVEVLLGTGASATTADSPLKQPNSIP